MYNYAKNKEADRKTQELPAIPRFLNCCKAPPTFCWIVLQDGLKERVHSDILQIGLLCSGGNAFGREEIINFKWIKGEVGGESI